MPRTQILKNALHQRVGLLLLFGVSTLLVSSADAAENGGAVLSGVVKDSQGVTQMGALVQVLAANSTTVATAFTDHHGHYTIANLAPGAYVVRASQTLFVPVSRGNLQLRSGAMAVVNLTLAALYETTSWLPAERRKANEPDDDWKWTLRSTANRPILRMVEDGEVIEISSSADPDHHRTPETRAKATVSSGDGGFGRGGVHNIVALRSLLEDGSDTMLRADVGSSRVPSAYGPSQEFDAGYERRMGYDGAARTVVTYKAHPELLGAGSASGVTVLEVASAQRTNLGDLLEVEAGGSAETVHTVDYTLAAHPFVRLTAHAGKGWTVHYRYATERETQAFDDVTIGRSDVPVALVEQGRLRLDEGRHQELAAAHRGTHGGVEVVYYHDVITRAAVSGGGASGPSVPSSVTQESPISGMLVDPTTGTFRTLAAGYTSEGARVTWNAPITTGLWIAAEYSVGSALSSTTWRRSKFHDIAPGVESPQRAGSHPRAQGKVDRHPNPGPGVLSLAAGRVCYGCRPLQFVQRPGVSELHAAPADPLGNASAAGNGRND